MNNLFLSKKFANHMEERVRYFEKSFFISSICCLFIAAVSVPYTIFSKESIAWLAYGIKSFPLAIAIIGFFVVLGLLILIGHYEDFITLGLSKILLAFIVLLHSGASLFITIESQEYFTGYLYIGLTIYQIYIILYFRIMRRTFRSAGALFLIGATEILIGFAIEYGIRQQLEYSLANMILVIIFTLCLVMNWNSLESYDMPGNDKTERGRAEPIFGAFAILLFFFSFVIYLFAKGSSRRNFDTA
ncbi:hypothetical protein [Leptospira kmetyi]|uniref:hypothetical protein n=1 Tax=Leptospira kmetyi TaxID=408139 RepID=UPI003EB8264C